IKLAGFGLADKVAQINGSAVDIARKAIGDSDTLIAGSIGPIGSGIMPLGRVTAAQAQKAFVTQLQALRDGGIDFFVLETFADPNELKIALNVAAEVAPDMPVVAMLTVNHFSETSYGHKGEEALVSIAQHPNSDVVGFNCSIGPSLMLTAVEKVKEKINKPMIVQPNAGLPKEVDGRMLYLSTPEYLAEYSKRFFECGARIIGGCCGTTPEHIREISRAIHSVDKAAISAQAAVKKELTTIEQALHDPAVPLIERSKFGHKLATGQRVVSIEVTPPRGFDLTNIIEKSKLCRDNGIDAINIPDGPRASSRLSPMITAIEIERQAQIESLLHVCCRDRNIISLQSDMLGAQAAGLRNMLLITGDPPKLGEYPDATAVFDLDAIGLTQIVHNLNCGIDVAGNEFDPGLSLVVGVGANPVAYELEREIER
ncbi:MAG: homocysteine S-methyltransferase family protein, partial [Desulfobacterales bacterium]|nr:homocysteine S-methyltransferase family protein [Desulfobacterales bacterium]